MMLPILISVSLAPVSYFFCASAPLEEAAITASAVESTASLLVTDIYVSLPFCCMPVWPVLGRHSFLAGRTYHFNGNTTIKSPPHYKREGLRPWQRGGRLAADVA